MTNFEDLYTTNCAIWVFTVRKYRRMRGEAAALDGSQNNRAITGKSVELIHSDFPHSANVLHHQSLKFVTDEITFRHGK